MVCEMDWHQTMFLLMSLAIFLPFVHSDGYHSSFRVYDVDVDEDEGPFVGIEDDVQDADTVVRVLEGANAVLPCTLVDDIGGIVWETSNGQVLSVGRKAYADRFSVELVFHPDFIEGMYTRLELRGVIPEDTGRYKCRQGAYPRAEQWVRLEIEADPVYTVTVKKGQTAELPCVVDESIVTQGFEAEMLSWGDGDYRFSQGKHIHNFDERLSVNNPSPDTWNLTIKLAQPADSGMYLCEIHGYPDFKNKVNLTVEDEEWIPDEALLGCTDRTGEPVKHGATFFASEFDICVQCTCYNDTWLNCESLECEPTCGKYTWSNEACCEYTCHDDPPTVSVKKVKAGEVGYQLTCEATGGYPEPNTTWYKDGEVLSKSDVVDVDFNTHIQTMGEYMCVATNGVEPDASETIAFGRLMIQQVGPTSLFVRLHLPGTRNKASISNGDWELNVKYQRGYKSQTVNFKDDLTAMVIDLSRDKEYDITLEYDDVEYSEEAVTLKQRTTTALVLSDAVGDVFESRGSGKKAGYTSLTTEEGVELSLNLGSFHRVEVVSHTGAPCPVDECGVLKMSNYHLNGKLKQVVSLMFADNQDFLWAKAHL